MNKTVIIGCPTNPALAWNYFQAMFPLAFDGARPRKGLKKEDLVLSAGLSLNASLLFGYAHLLRSYPECLEESAIKGIRSRLMSWIDGGPEKWMCGESQRLFKQAARFEDPRLAAEGLRPQGDFRKSERELFGAIVDWARLDESNRPPLEAAIYGRPHVDLDKLAACASMLERCAPSRRAQMLAILGAAGVMRLLPLPNDIRSRLDDEVDLTKKERDRVERGQHFFAHPTRVLCRMLSGVSAAEDVEWHTLIYLPAFMNAMAEPALLMDVMSSLRLEKGRIAPPPPQSGEWPELGVFMRSNNFDQRAFESWYAIVRRNEPDVVRYLTMAMTSRLRVVFEGALATVRGRAASGKGPFYEDLLEEAERLSGLGVADLDAWLNLRAETPEAADEGDPFEEIMNYRSHASRDPERFARMRREHTMDVGTDFAHMRGLARRPTKMPKAPEEIWDEVYRAFQTVNGQADVVRVGSVEQCLRIIGVLSPFNLTVPEILRAIEDWREQGADPAKLAYIGEQLRSLGLIG
jgi:hypothetical protein